MYSDTEKRKKSFRCCNRTHSSQVHWIPKLNKFVEKSTDQWKKQNSPVHQQQAGHVCFRGWNDYIWHLSEVCICLAVRTKAPQNTGLKVTKYPLATKKTLTLFPQNFWFESTSITTYVRENKIQAPIPFSVILSMLTLSQKNKIWYFTCWDISKQRLAFEWDRNWQHKKELKTQTMNQAQNGWSSYK